MFRRKILPLFSRHNLKIHITVLRVMTPCSLIWVLDLNSATIFRVEAPYYDLLDYVTSQSSNVSEPLTISIFMAKIACIKISVPLILLRITLLNARILNVPLELSRLITNKWKLRTSHFRTSRLHSHNNPDQELVCLVPCLPCDARSGIHSSIVKVVVIRWQTERSPLWGHNIVWNWLK